MKTIKTTSTIKKTLTTKNKMAKAITATKKKTITTINDIISKTTTTFTIIPKT